MRYSCPQITWHSLECEKGKNAPILSISILSSENGKQQILATAGDKEVHLWDLDSTETCPVKHKLTLTRSERTINTIAFSPDGHFLAVAGDGGAIFIYSVPMSSSTGRDFWFSDQLVSDKDLDVRILTSQCDDVQDLSWDPSSLYRHQRFAIGTLDSCVLVYENVTQENDSVVQFKCVTRHKDHSHYVQGVAFDPLGEHVASQSTDRTVRIATRKKKKKEHRKALAPKTTSVTSASQVVSESSIGTKFEFGGKSRVVKFEQQTEESSSIGISGAVAISDSNTQVEEQSSDEAKTKRYRNNIFADEAIASFFRRLTWTPDGAFMIAPAGLWYDDEGQQKSSSGDNATFIFARSKLDYPVATLTGPAKPSLAVRCCPTLFKISSSSINDVNDSGDTSNTTSTTTTSEKENDLSCSPLPYKSVFAVLTTDGVVLYDTHQLKPLCGANDIHHACLTDAEWTSDGKTLVVSSRDGYVSFLMFEEGELGDVYQSILEIEDEVEVTSNPTSLMSNVSTSVSDVAVTKTSSSVVTVTAPKQITDNDVVALPPCQPGSIEIEAPPTKKLKTAPFIDTTNTKKRERADDGNNTDGQAGGVICIDDDAENKSPPSAGSGSFETAAGGGGGSEEEARKQVNNLSLDLVKKKKRITPTFVTK